MPQHPAIKGISFTPTNPVPPKPTLTDWDVKRSGPAQTVTGKLDGRQTKIAGVTRVKRAAGRTFALDGRGAVLAYLAD